MVSEESVHAKARRPEYRGMRFQGVEFRALFLKVTSRLLTEPRAPRPTSDDSDLHIKFAIWPPQSWSGGDLAFSAGRSQDWPPGGAPYYSTGVGGGQPSPGCNEPRRDKTQK